MELNASGALVRRPGPGVPAPEGSLMLYPGDASSAEEKVGFAMTAASARLALVISKVGGYLKEF